MSIRVWKDNKISKPSGYDDVIKEGCYHFFCQRCDNYIVFNISHITYKNVGRDWPNQFKCPDCEYNHILWWDLIRYYLQEK